jgi:fructose-bisphosphate aldolase class II
METLLGLIKNAEKNKVAIGHFNISDSVALRAIFEAAQELSVRSGSASGGKAPVIIGTSEGEAKFLGRNVAAAMVKRLREDNSFPIFINSDHTHSLEEVKDAVSAGYDAIIFDASKLSFEENIKQTKQAVEYIKSKSKNILVEGEIGYIGGSSQVLKSMPSGIAIRPEDLTRPEEAVRFVKETGIDLLAPAVGNLHGIIMAPDVEGNLKSMNPKLDVKRISEIKKAVDIPLVLHGGSGTSDEDFKSAINSGIGIIHINTEIRMAWKNALEASLLANKDEVAPYKILEPSFEAVKSVVKSRLQLFNKLI